MRQEDPRSPKRTSRRQQEAAGTPWRELLPLESAGGRGGGGGVQRSRLPARLGPDQRRSGSNQFDLAKRYAVVMKDSSPVCTSRGESRGDMTKNNNGNNNNNSNRPSAAIQRTPGPIPQREADHMPTPPSPNKLQQTPKPPLATTPRAPPKTKKPKPKPAPTPAPRPHQYCAWCGHLGHAKPACADLTAALQARKVRLERGKIALVLGDGDGDGRDETIPYPHGRGTLRDWVGRRYRELGVDVGGWFGEGEVKKGGKGEREREREVGGMKVGVMKGREMGGRGEVCGGGGVGVGVGEYRWS